MSDVSTAHSGSIRWRAVASAYAAAAATVTRNASASCALRERVWADRRFKKVLMCPVPKMLQANTSYRRHWTWLLPVAHSRLERWYQPAYPVRKQRGNTMADETATLAAYVANLKFEDIPHEVLERAKVLTLDFLGSAIRARRDAESTPSLLKMLEALSLDTRGEATVFGDDKTWTPAVAALLNGALGHSLDFDDTHADSSLHASAPVVPAAFAVGELTGASGRDVLTAIVAGYEVCCRLGNALDPTSHYARGFHPTATAGAKLFGLSKEQIIAAFGVSGSQAAGSLQFLVNGAWNKRYQVGAAAMNGVIAATLARNDFVGATESVEGKHGLLVGYSDDAHPDKVVAGLGK